MITLLRFATRLICAVLMACSVACAQNAGGTQALGLPPELAALLDGKMTWSASASVNAGYGFKDNLLLSSSDEERSTFARGEMELLLLRVPTDRFDFSFYTEVERTYYFTAQTSDHDAKVWVQTEPGYRAGDSLRFSLPITGYYYDQVFDVSTTDADRVVARLKLRGGMIGPQVHWDFLPAWWVEVQALGQRKLYADGVNDNRVGEGVVRVGWSPWDRLELKLSGAERWRGFDHRVQYTAPAGREIPDTHLKIAEREGELRVGLAWDEARHWHTVTRASLLDYRDNGSGYFNYREQKVGQDLEWKGEPWLLRLGGSASRIDFDVQKVGLGNPPPRLKDEFTTEVHVERRIAKNWTVFGSYNWERSRCNDLIASYSVNEGLLGVRWSWDK